jgi:hypothetical protein
MLQLQHGRYALRMPIVLLPFQGLIPMSFLKLRIRGRLYGGFGLLLLFCAALAGFAVWQLGGIHGQVGTMTMQSNNAIRVGEITTELQAARRAILRYTSTRTNLPSPNPTGA